ncbi:MAG: 1-acyl-sn-glycerol-3-phosphate acyltransferase [Kofleriaceae bacterium]|nr:1-acyl-sn-glycerol-3-phosphate acyltransferase [Kofleriaceae bacterium]
MTAQLSRMEQLSMKLCQSINEQRTLKTLQRYYMEYVCCPWIHASTSNLRTVYGLDNLHKLNPDAGVILCANHRSFIDLYVVAGIMYKAKLPWNQRHFYPVRSTYFYESLSGLGMNLVIGGGSMYPPIFRDSAKSEYTKAGLDTVSKHLTQYGSVVGLHPEGKRSKDPDPFSMLPGQPGIGQIAHHSGAPVIPIWIRGLSNDVGKQILSNFQTGDKRGSEVVVAFGKPVDLSEYLAKKGRVAIYKRMSDTIVDAIQELGAQDRERSGL